MGKPRKFYPKKLSKKKSKVELKFDSSERREFLTGLLFNIIMINLMNN